MKNKGRDTKYDKEAIKKAVSEWINGADSANTVSKKYGIPEAVLFYHAKKERNKDVNKQ